MSQSQTAGILAGLRVVELSAFVAAPLGGATLAALGAEVVRVDPPGGGIDAKRWPLYKGESLYWAGLNQGKRSVNVDTRGERGQALVADLIATAGIVLTNLPVRGWSSYERLKERRPDLIMAVLRGNPDGTAAVDYTVNAAVGFPFVTGPEGHAGPVDHVLPAWDVAAGYLLATGLLAAELHRVRTGQGQLIELSLADVGLAVAGHLGLIGEAQLCAEPRGRFGNDLFGSYGRDFRTADGRYVMAVALTARQWQSLTEATGLTERMRQVEVERGLDLRQETDRFAARHEISALLAEWVAARPLAEVRQAFDRHNVLWGPFQTFQELVRNDPRCSAANSMFAEVDQPGLGRYLRAATPLSFSNAPRVPPRASPLMGADTRGVLQAWLGLEAPALDALAADRVIPA